MSIDLLGKESTCLSNGKSSTISNTAKKIIGPGPLPAQVYGTCALSFRVGELLGSFEHLTMPMNLLSSRCRQKMDLYKRSLNTTMVYDVETPMIDITVLFFSEPYTAMLKQQL